MIGINSAGIPDAQNVGFAIAIDTVKPLLSRLQNGQGSGSGSGSGGAGGSGTTGQGVAFLGISTSQTVAGLTITGVTAGSGADKAGLRVGDVITKAGGQTIETPADLAAVLQASKPGATMAIEVTRRGTTTTVNATLGTRTQ